MFNPPHPGEALRDDVLPSISLTINALAEHLSYPRTRLAAVLNCRAAICADLAVRLERAGLGSARMYLAEQAAYDLWQAQQRDVSAISRLQTVDLEDGAGQSDQ